MGPPYQCLWIEKEALAILSDEVRIFVTGKTMPDKFYDLKMKSRKGCGINTIEDLLEEENVYYCRSFVPVDFLKTWKLGRIL